LLWICNILNKQTNKASGVEVKASKLIQSEFTFYNNIIMNKTSIGPRQLLVLPVSVQVSSIEIVYDLP